MLKISYLFGSPLVSKTLLVNADGEVSPGNICYPNLPDIIVPYKPCFARVGRSVSNKGAKHLVPTLVGLKYQLQPSFKVIMVSHTILCRPPQNDLLTAAFPWTFSSEFNSL